MTAESTIENGMLYEGRVKWFNNKTGYGFVTVIGGDREGDDIFVHHTAITVDDKQYKYLVQGEYIEFSISEVDSGTHKHVVSSVRGVKGGKLLCETRNEIRANAPQRPKKSRDTASARRPAPKEDEEWVLVKKTAAEAKSTST